MLDFLIRRTVDKAVRETIDKKLDDAIDRAIRANPRFQFVKTMQLQMLGCDPQMDPRKAWNIAVDNLNIFLADEGIQFGDPRYDWSRDAAVTLIHKQEMHYWESAA